MNAMKIIFLDIDGVLNSDRYDRKKSEADGNIDKSRLPLLKRLIDETGARTVLSSSWREHWEREASEMSDAGKELSLIFLQAGIKIFDKTPFLSSRKEEINHWLSLHPEVEGFVILDDNIFGWGELSDYVIKTNNRNGKGLEEEHIIKAKKILCGE